MIDFAEPRGRHVQLVIEQLVKHDSDVVGRKGSHDDVSRPQWRWRQQQRLRPQEHLQPEVETELVHFLQRGLGGEAGGRHPSQEEQRNSRLFPHQIRM